jgi:hypothetical protein
VTDDEKQLFKVTAEATLKPLGNLLERLFGGAVDQIGGEWEDRLKARRSLRRAMVYAKLKRQLDDAGIDPQEIPEKIWVPALQAASLEDDESLQDKWASLLAHAGDPRSRSTISDMFPKVLANLTGREAKALDLYFDFATRRVPEGAGSRDPNLISTLSSIDATMIGSVLEGPGFVWSDDTEKQNALGRFITEGLIHLQRKFNDSGATTLARKISASEKLPTHLSSDLRKLFSESYSLSLFGVHFVMACRPPIQSPSSAQ